MNFLANKSCQDIRKAVYEESESYIYFSDNDNVKSEDFGNLQFTEDRISVPRIDIEQTIKALCFAKDGKSSAVYSPFYESEYLPYPIIISARKLLFGKDDSLFLVIGGKSQWQTVLKNVYCHGNIGNHALSKYYKYIDILDTNANNRYPTSKQYKKIRWVFSGFYNSDLWRLWEDAALIVVDMVTTDIHPEPDKSDIETILTHSARNSIPAVFFIRNDREWVAKYLQEKKVEILSPPIDLFNLPSVIEPETNSYNTHDLSLNTFLTSYNLRSYKINKNGVHKAIEINIVKEDSNIRNFHQKYLKLQSTIMTWDNNDTGKSVLSRAKTLYNSVMEFTGNVNTNINSRFEWKTHPIETNRVRFSDSIWKLGESSRVIATELIDEVNAIVENFEFKATPKGERLSELLINYKTENKTVLVLGEESAVGGFLHNQFPEGSKLPEKILITPKQLTNANPADIIILLNLAFRRDRATLLTSCSKKLIVLNYYWQNTFTQKSIEEAKGLLLGNLFLHGERNLELNPKPVDPFDVSVTGFSDHSVQADEKALPETNIDNSISAFDFSEYGELQDADDENEIDDDLSYPNVIMGIDNPYELRKWVVPIENREVVIPENRNIVLLSENRTYLVKPAKLKPGDRILITKEFSPKSLSDFVWEIMERKLGIKRKTHPGNQWREKLNEYMVENQPVTYQQVLEKLKQMCDIGIKTPTAIYLWLESYDVIGPRDYGTLKAISKLVNSEEKLQEWWGGIQYIRSRHRRMIRHLWKISTYTAKELKEKTEGDYVVDPTLGIKISEISRLLRFATITGTPRHLEKNS